MVLTACSVLKWRGRRARAKVRSVRCGRLAELASRGGHGRVVQIPRGTALTRAVGAGVSILLRTLKAGIHTCRKLMRSILLAWAPSIKFEYRTKQQDLRLLLEAISYLPTYILSE
eukprot:1762010-Pleurochrysis_carterae.AAC.1